MFLLHTVRLLAAAGLEDDVQDREMVDTQQQRGADGGQASRAAARDELDDLDDDFDEMDEMHGFIVPEDGGKARRRERSSTAGNWAGMNPRAVKVGRRRAHRSFVVSFGCVCSNLLSLSNWHPAVYKRFFGKALNGRLSAICWVFVRHLYQAVGWPVARRHISGATGIWMPECHRSFLHYPDVIL